MKILIRDSQYEDTGNYIKFNIFVYSSDSAKIKCPNSDQKYCRPRISQITSLGLATISFPFDI